MVYLYFGIKYLIALLRLTMHWDNISPSSLSTDLHRHHTNTIRFLSLTNIFLKRHLASWFRYFLNKKTIKLFEILKNTYYFNVTCSLNIIKTWNYVRLRRSLASFIISDIWVLKSRPFRKLLNNELNSPPYHWNRYVVFYRDYHWLTGGWQGYFCKLVDT